MAKKHGEATAKVPIQEEQYTSSERMEDHDDETPLLGRADNQAGNKRQKWWFAKASNPLRADTTHARFRHVPLMACLIILLNEMGFYTNYIPTLRMIESMRCIEYYQKVDPSIIDTYGRWIPERLCKSVTVQKDVVTTMGLVTFVRMIGSLGGTVWLGWMADRYSRKWALFLNKLGWVNIGAAHLFIYLTFPLLPVWSMYVACGFALFAGNFDIGLAITFSSITDVVPSDAQRGSLFFLISSMLSVAQAVCPLLGGFLMNLDGQGGTPWVPFSIGILAAVTATSLSAFAFPETLDKTRLKPKTGPEEGIRASSTVSENGMLGTQPTLFGKLKRKTRAYFSKPLAKFDDDNNKGIGVFSMLSLTIAMLCVTLGIKGLDLSILPLYATIKLHWIYTQTTFTMSLQAVICIINFMFITPYLIRRGERRSGGHPTSLYIMLWSGILLIAGMVIVGFSATTWTFLTGVIIYTCGQGYPTALQAYLATIIDRNNIGRVLSVMSLAQTTGKMVQSVLFPKILTLGLNTHIYVLVGLPCFVGAGIFGVTMLCTGLYMLYSSRDKGKKNEV